MSVRISVRLSLFRHSSFVALWLYGFVALWLCGFVVMWFCGFIIMSDLKKMYPLGSAAWRLYSLYTSKKNVWLYGFVALWFCGFVVFFNYLCPDKKSLFLTSIFGRTKSEKG